MEKIVNALMLRATDYNENDKILTLLTCENGKISARVKGVKKSGAKLKFAAQPFCFAEYVLAERGGRYTVINATECESFYDLRTDINKFYAASAVSEAACALTYEGDECGEIFSSCVKALTDICNGDETLSLILFLDTALRLSGYGVNGENCSVCGKELTGETSLRFDMDLGSFTCEGCSSGPKASLVTYNVLRKIQGKSFEEDFITADGEKRLLRLFREYISYKLNVNFKSLAEYIRLI